MSRNNEIIAVARYYNIPKEKAYTMIQTMTEEEIETCTEWFLDHEGELD